VALESHLELCCTHRLWSRRRGIVWNTEADQTDLSSALEPGRAAEAAGKSDYQLRVTFLFQRIGRSGPARSSRSELDFGKEDHMSNSSLNLRTLFSFPDAVAATPPSNQWQEFQSRLSREIKTIRWPAAMPDLVSKIGELFNIELPDLLILSWKKAAQLQETLEESRRSPEQVIVLDLAEHAITNKYHPYVEIRIAGMPLPKKIEFQVEITTSLKGIILKIQAGNITEIQAGSCDFKGELTYQDLTLADKRVGPIELLGVSTITKPEPSLAK
jgi:hypothetical protein